MFCLFWEQPNGCDLKNLKRSGSPFENYILKRSIIGVREAKVF